VSFGSDIPNARRVSRDELAATLRWAAELVDEDDSAQANIQYGWSEEPGTYLLAGAVRFGNQMGQGSVRILGELPKGGESHGS
jgi:hypothetical protein